jgi:hypothetical protein
MMRSAIFVKRCEEARSSRGALLPKTTLIITEEPIPSDEVLELLVAVKRFEFAKDARNWKQALRMHESMCLLLSAAHLEIDRSV